ncbi:MAG: HDOD domain-containing protein [Burkholderiales bacterium]|nr:HDOD domain-containing protein [Phycisphaerae bacterium]
MPDPVSPTSSTSRVGLILQQLDQLPTLPAIAMRVLHVASSDTSSVKDVCALIETDPALTTRILQLVHRADSGISGEVTSIERAIVMLGFESVRCAVLAVSVFATFEPASAASSTFSRQDFWKHCIATGCAAELIAQQLKTNWGRSAVVEPATAFTAGLLHDVGKIALDAAIPKSFARVVEATDMLRGNIADVERNVVGIDHTVVGKRLAEKWQLPAAMRDAIWLHGQLPQALPASVRNDRLVNIITLADILVREQHLGYSGNYTFPIPRQILLDALGLLPQQLDDICAKLVDAIESRARTLGLGSTEAQDLYRQALQQAHQELSRVTDQLASRNRKLSMRAKYFEALAAFQSELRPDAPPGVVTHAIGQTAAAVLETAVVAVFSMPPGVGYAEVTLVDRTGERQQSHLIEMSPPVESSADAVMPERPVPGDGPVLAVGPNLEWLIQAFSPRLAGTGRYWICLEADGICIGGVVWGAEAGEAQRLSGQIQELSALTGGWSLALRTCQIRDEARALSEQLADANRRLQSVQSEVVRTRMLTTVAEMAAGAAHEMNNPLAVISGRSQLLASTLSDPRDKRSAELIFDKSQKLSDIITELMHFAKPQPPQIAPTPVSAIFDAAIEQAKGHSPIADRQIEVRVGDVPMADVDAGQVGSALAEIVLNAIQATDPAKGRITLTASFDAFSHRVVLSVTDDGCGMDDHVLRHAFDPFFSARTAGRRQGMGLPKALRWIESSGGSIRLESRTGAGTCAIVVLPGARQAKDNPVLRASQGS